MIGFTGHVYTPEKVLTAPQPIRGREAQMNEKKSQVTGNDVA
jgi:hypothetical protein